MLRRSKASKAEQLQGLQYEFEHLRSQVAESADSAKKLESKTGILTAGLQVCVPFSPTLDTHLSPVCVKFVMHFHVCALCLCACIYMYSSVY